MLPSWLNFVTGAYFAGVQADPDRVRGYVDEIGLEDISTYCKNNLRAFPYAQEPNVSLTERGLVAISAGFSKIHSVLYFCCKMTNATASSPWRSETVPSGTRLVVNAARLETKWYLWMSSCSVSYGACLLLAQRFPRVRVIQTLDQKVSQSRNSSYTEQWQHGGST
ncbi:hypothetical protein FXO37_25725 [Capsicum annuum]|nr:hypothetical protein FXO37_25725 [Capsicum annuum]